MISHVTGHVISRMSHVISHVVGHVSSHVTGHVISHVTGHVISHVVGHVSMLKHFWQAKCYPCSQMLYDSMKVGGGV